MKRKESAAFPINPYKYPYKPHAAGPLPSDDFTPKLSLKFLDSRINALTEAVERLTYAISGPSEEDEEDESTEELKDESDVPDRMVDKKE